MAQSIPICHFSKQDWHSDVWVKKPRHSETKSAEMCYLYRRSRSRRLRVVPQNGTGVLKGLTEELTLPKFRCDTFVFFHFCTLLVVSLKRVIGLHVQYLFLKKSLCFGATQTRTPRKQWRLPRSHHVSDALISSRQLSSTAS